MRRQANAPAIARPLNSEDCVDTHRLAPSLEKKMDVDAGNASENECPGIFERFACTGNAIKLYAPVKTSENCAGK